MINKYCGKSNLSCNAAKLTREPGFPSSPLVPFLPGMPCISENITLYRKADIKITLEKLIMGSEPIKNPTLFLFCIQLCVTELSETQ